MNNKLTLTMLLALSITLGARAQEKFAISGSVVPYPQNQTIHLYYTNGAMGLAHDSCKVENGKFTFKGEVGRKTLGFLAVPPDGIYLNQYMSEHGKLPPDQLGIYLENGVINVNIKDQDLEKTVISGTFENNAVNDARPLIWKYKKAEENISQKLVVAGENSTERDLIVNEHKKMSRERATAVGAFIKAHPNALASLDLLRRWVLPPDDLNAAKLYYSYLSEDLKKSPYGRQYAQIIQQSASVDIGSMAPDFKLKSPDGTDHLLSDYKGKYILIDFWASWCVPCRKENPNLIKAYNEFKSKKFEIIGVSLDGGNSAQENWIKAIKSDKLTWPQLSDLEGWNSSVAKSYRITSIPSNFLIDPTGRIIAKDLRGAELLQSLKQYL